MRSYDELYILLLWFLLILFPKSTSRHQHPIRGEEGKTTSIILMTSFWYILIALRWFVWYILIALRWFVLICDDFLLTHRLIKLSFPWSQAFRVLGLSFTGCLANQVYPRGLFLRRNQMKSIHSWYGHLKKGEPLEFLYSIYHSFSRHLTAAFFTGSTPLFS